MVTFVAEFVSRSRREWALGVDGLAGERGIDPRDWAAMTALRREVARTDPPPEATVADVVAHLEHVREVAGIEHIGLGGDYDGVEVLPVGLEDVSGYPRLLAALAERGWSDAELAALTSGNALRVLRDVESSARTLQQQRGASTATITDLDG